jgi:hypothetical protein
MLDISLTWDVAGRRSHVRGVAMLMALWAITASPGSAQTRPTPLKQVLAMPVSPGSVALLALHAEEPEAGACLASAIANHDPAVRTSAARVIFARGVRSLLPAVALALAQERQRQR